MNSENRDELYSIVRRTIYDARIGLDMIRQLLDHGFPSADKKEEYYFLRYEFPDLAEVQEKMTSLVRSSGKDEPAENLLSSAETLVKEISDRLTSLRVILQDLFSNADLASDADQGLHYSLLATLAYLKKPLELRSDRLYQLFEEEGIWGAFDERTLFDETDDEPPEEAVDLWEDEKYYTLFLNVKNALIYYQEQHPDEDVVAFVGYVQDCFSGFADHQRQGGFLFSFEVPYGNEGTFYSFRMDRHQVEVSRSRDLFSPGGDEEDFTNRAFSIHEDGSAEGTLELGSNDLFSFIDAGAKLIISLPEEFILTEFPEEE